MLPSGQQGVSLNLKSVVEAAVLATDRCKGKLHGARLLT